MKGPRVDLVGQRFEYVGRCPFPSMVVIWRGLVATRDLAGPLFADAEHPSPEPAQEAQR